MWSDHESRFWQGYLPANYGIDAEPARLDGEFDLNIAARLDGRLHAVLKIMRSDCQIGLADMQVAALGHLAKAAPDLPVPVVIPRLDGAGTAPVSGPLGDDRIAWLISALDGMPLGRMRPQPASLINRTGTALGGIATGLQGFDHPSLIRDFKWHPLYPHWAFPHVDEILDEEIKSIINKYFHIFKNEIESKILEFGRFAIHCDGNDYNLLVTPSLEGPALSGVIDFGDMVSAPHVCDLAAAAYMVLDKPRPMAALQSLVAGYVASCPLSPGEIDLVYPLMMVRLGVSLVNSAMMARERPDDRSVRPRRRPSLRRQPAGTGVRSRAGSALQPALRSWTAQTGVSAGCRRGAARWPLSWAAALPTRRFVPLPSGIRSCRPIRPI